MIHAGRFRLDRMDIEEAGPDPRRLAAAIHARLPPLSGRVPIREIARQLDIVEIREAPTSGMEAALVTTEERGEGAILVNASSSPRRQAFSVAHELGHFLNPVHRPTLPAMGFACTMQDLQSSSEASRHNKQEAEANRFAIELLAPERLVRPFLLTSPDLGAVVSLGDALWLSREASARRYVEHHPVPIVVVFSRNGIVRYSQAGQGFRHRLPASGRHVPLKREPRQIGLSDPACADARLWLSPAATPTTQLIAQTLGQQDGYAITLLTLGAPQASRKAS